MLSEGFFFSSEHYLSEILCVLKLKFHYQVVNTSSSSQNPLFSLLHFPQNTNHLEASRMAKEKLAFLTEEKNQSKQLEKFISF